MTRLFALVGLGALFLLAASCGTHQSPPSVSIKAASSLSGPPILHLSFTSPDASSTSQVWLYDVLPSGGPSGDLALESVHDGRVTTLRWPLRFQDLKSAGTAAVLVNGNLIETCFVAGEHESGPSVVGEKTQGGGFWATHSLVKGGQDEVFWITNRYAGPVEGGHEWDAWNPGPHVDLSDVIAISRKIPSMTSYCLTVSVDKASR